MCASEHVFLILCRVVNSKDEEIELYSSVECKVLNVALLLLSCHLMYNSAS